MNLAKIKWKKCAICFKKSSIKYLDEFLLKDEGLFYRSFDLNFEQCDNLERCVHTTNININILPRLIIIQIISKKAE